MKNILRKISIFILVAVSFFSQTNAFTIHPSDKEDLISYYSTIQGDEIVWWNTTELSTEPYTAPFFEVYNLKDYGQCAFGLDVADFNNDSWLDFAVNWATDSGDHYAGISIFYRYTENSFRINDIKKFEYPTEDLEVGDFDNDGDDDILFSTVLDGYNNEYSVFILWNNKNEFEMSNEITHFNRSAGYWINPHLACADFDNDGDVDFLVGANCGKVKLFLNDGANNFSDEGVIFDYGTVSWGLDTGDFNKDGYPDFIVSAETEPGEYPFNDIGHIYLKLNDQTSNCFNNTTPGICVASVPFPDDYTIGAATFGSVAALDYNADGLLDIIYGGDWKIFLLIQQVDGDFLPFNSVYLRGRELNWSDRLRAGGFTVGDFNYDGFDDVVVGGVQGTVRLFINNHTFFQIVKPVDRFLYVFGEQRNQLKFPGRKVILGDIEVIAVGIEPLSHVDFYLNNKLVISDDSEPFVWDWTTFGFGKNKVAAEAYDNTGEFAGRDTFIVWKFL